MVPENSMTDLLSLEGRVAVVTGASSGIGRATSLIFSRCGASTALLDIDRAKGKDVETEISALRAKALFIACDVRKRRECAKAVEEVISAFGRIDILFNNAGVIVRKGIEESTEEEWDFVVDVNLKGIFLLSHFVVPHMKRGGGGSIINTGSGWGLRGGQDASAYCASKGGVVNLTRAMAIDLGKYNIRVNSVCPGDTDTAMLRDEASQLHEKYDAFLADAARRPLARVGKPEDVAHAALFLASDMSSWVTGSTLVVDGGGTA